MGQTSPRREKAPSRPQAQPGMWYLSSWRNLPRRSNAGHGLLNKPEITPPSHSNHHRDGTFRKLKKWSLGVVATGWDGKGCSITPRDQTAEPQAQSRAWI